MENFICSYVFSLIVPWKNLDKSNLIQNFSEKKRTRPAGLGTVYQPLFVFEKNHLD